MQKAGDYRSPALLNQTLLSLRRFGLQRVLGNLDEFTKTRVVRRGDVGNDLAIQTHLRGLQSFHESAVSCAGSTGGRVDANLPERAESAFLGLAIAESVLAAMVQRVRGIAIQFGPAHAKAFGGFQCAHPALA